MQKSLSVRLDADALAALRVLESQGLGRSEAIRTALLEAAELRTRGTALAAEVAAVASDPDYQREMKEVLAFMESLDAEG